MRIPRKVMIGSIPYDVKIKNYMRQGLDYCGEIFEADQIIHIKSMEGKDTMNVAFLHECIHGMLYNLGIIEHDEQLIDGLAHEFYSFIRNNKDIFNE